MRENVSDDICPNEKYTVVKNNAHKSRVNSCFARSLSTFYLCLLWLLMSSQRKWRCAVLLVCRIELINHQVLGAIYPTELTSLYHGISLRL